MILHFLKLLDFILDQILQLKIQVQQVWVPGYPDINLNICEQLFLTHQPGTCRRRSHTGHHHFNRRLHNSDTPSHLNVVLAEHAFLHGSKVESAFSPAPAARAYLVFLVSVLVAAPMVVLPVVLCHCCIIVKVVAILVLVGSADSRRTASLVICVHIHFF